MRYFRDGVLKMIIKKVLPGDGSTFLYHNSESFHGKETIETHREIADAIAAHDPLRAQDAMYLHLVYNRKRILLAMK